MRYLLASIVLIGLLAGCTAQPAGSEGKAGATKGTTPHKPGSTEQPTELGQSTPFDTIILSRSPCFGRCPVYSVTVHGDGQVEYDGERWVAMTGRHEGHADSQALEALGNMLGSRRLPLIADYRPGKPACGQPVATDMPGATITIRQGKVTTTFHYYKGCPNVPDWLPALAEQIDQAAVSGRWVGNDRAAEILKQPD